MRWSLRCLNFTYRKSIAAMKATIDTTATSNLMTSQWIKSITSGNGMVMVADIDTHWITPVVRLSALKFLVPQYVDGAHQHAFHRHNGNPIRQ